MYLETVKHNRELLVLVLWFVLQMERKEPVGGASTDVKKDGPDIINRSHQPHIEG